ncbi:Manganese transporter smf1 [Marasmius sp. AFHP31]|nr:Manganese transporter smf1 [Marasmius sp. AFHP31]
MAVISHDDMAETDTRAGLSDRTESEFAGNQGRSRGSPEGDGIEHETWRRRWMANLSKVAYTVFNHFKTHMGVGMVCAVAYFDPGNWGVDLKAGSEYGYRLLFVVLVAGLFAVYFQVLASRLGCVTGLDLASHCRLLLNHSRKSRWLVLYPLYVLSEVAIIATDLAELLGSAIALVLLFPKLKLWHGVLITTFDVLVLLAFGDPLGGQPARWFEWIISGLVLAVLVCICVILGKVNVDWGDAFEGYLPSKYIFPSGALYTSVGILGATVMPHSLFLGSALSTQDRVQSVQPTHEKHTISIFSLKRFSLPRARAFLIHAFQKPPPNSFATSAKRHSERENKSLEFVKQHLYHGIVDVAISLLGFAVLINSSILIISSAVFFPDDGDEDPAGLFDAYELIKDTVGKGAATLFAVALLAAGQSASIVATVAGQAVSEGFLEWRTSPILRRLITRLLSLVPSMTVAVVMGRSGIDVLLIASQVVLAVVLPFVTLPLLWLTSRKEVMRARSAVARPGGPGSVEGVEALEKDAEGVTMGRVDTLEEGVSTACESSVTIEEKYRVRKENEEPVTEIPESTNSPQGEIHREGGEDFPRGKVDSQIQVTRVVCEDQVESQPPDRSPYVYFNNGPVGAFIGGVIWLVVVAANGFLIVTLAMGKGEG